MILLQVDRSWFEFEDINEQESFYRGTLIKAATVLINEPIDDIKVNHTAPYGGNVVIRYVGQQSRFYVGHQYRVLSEFQAEELARIYQSRIEAGE